MFYKVSDVRILAMAECVQRGAVYLGKTPDAWDRHGRIIGYSYFFKQPYETPQVMGHSYLTDYGWGWRTV